MKAKKTGLAQATKKPPLTPDAWVNEKLSSSSPDKQTSRLVVDIEADLHRQLKSRVCHRGHKNKGGCQHPFKTIPFRPVTHHKHKTIFIVLCFSLLPD